MRPLAIALLSLLLAPFVYAAAPPLGALLVLVAAGACAWAATLALSPKLRRRDAYDLAELKRVHEKEELRSLDPEGPLGTPDHVVCSRCFEEYPSRLRACPRCGASG